MINLIKKIKMIEESTNINELTLDVLPPIYNEDYYFVCYSHKDYKKVYKDLLLLQEKGISLWYDHGMTPGRDWKETAEQMIGKFSCKGVIFYASENSVSSKPCVDELEFTNKIGKSFCSINLSYSKDNNIYSATDLCNLIDVPRNNKRVIKKLFSSTVIYMNETDSIEKKINGIKKMKQPQLLSYEIFRKPDWQRLIERGIYDIYEGDIPEDDLPYISKNYFYYCTLSSVLDMDIKSLKIPEHIYTENNNLVIDKLTPNSKKTKVTKIKRCAFANCRRLTKINLPNSIENIYDSAFLGCSSLEEFNLPSKIKEISDSLFYDCVNLKNINLTSINSIGDLSFKNCKKLKKVISLNCKHIGYSAFTNCSSLKEVKVNLSTISSSTFAYCVSLKNFSSSSKILEIGNNAFFQCSNLEKIDAQFSVKKIPTFAFYKCTNLQEISFDDNLIEIEERAFAGCESLKSFVFNDNLLSLEQASFTDCKNLRTVTFNNKLQEIGLGCFANCKKLKKINFGKELRTIGMSAFSNCEELEEVILPDNLETINELAFAGCYKLKKLVIPKSIKKMNNILSNNHKLKEIYYNGTLADLFKVSGYDCLFNGKVNYTIICLDEKYIRTY